LEFTCKSVAMPNHRQYEKPNRSADRRSAFVRINGRIGEVTVYRFGIPPTIHPAIYLPLHSDCFSGCSRIQFVHDCFTRTHARTHTHTHIDGAWYFPSVKTAMCSMSKAADWQNTACSLPD